MIHIVAVAPEDYLELCARNRRHEIAIYAVDVKPDQKERYRVCYGDDKPPQEALEIWGYETTIQNRHPAV